jgi:hypothetical protein
VIILTVVGIAVYCSILIEKNEKKEKMKLKHESESKEKEEEKGKNETSSAKEEIKEEVYPDSSNTNLVDKNNTSVKEFRSKTPMINKNKKE